jgi:uncharacterized protein
VVRSPRRVVIDPNVLVSGAISSGGASAEVIDLMDAALIVPIVSPALLAELSEVLGREKFRRYLDLESAMAYVVELERLGETWDDPEDVSRVARDPTDDYLIALARAAEVDTIVSGDLDLASLELPDLAVLSPRGLLESVATGGQDEGSGRS